MSLRRLLVLAAALVFVLGFGPAQSAETERTFYVSATGSDAADGTTQAGAWRTLERVNRAELAPGDRVLFQGGRWFPGTLMPEASGTRTRPILFASYGTGRARIGGRDGAVWLPPGTSYVRFSNLELTARGAWENVFGASAEGAGSVGVVIERSLIYGARGIGIVAPKPSDTDWTIWRNTVTRVGDSGIIFLGARFSVVGNRIEATGSNRSIAWGKHGIYAKGPFATIRDNVIERFTSSGVTLRFRAAKVLGNRISRGPIGISWFQNGRVGGETTIARNRISATTAAGVYISPRDEGGGTRESFTLDGNRVTTAAGAGLDIGRTSGYVTLTGNHVGGRHEVTVVLTRPRGAFVDSANTWTRDGAPPRLVVDGVEVEALVG